MAAARPVKAGFLDEDIPSSPSYGKIRPVGIDPAGAKPEDPGKAREMATPHPEKTVIAIIAKVSRCGTPGLRATRNPTIRRSRPSTPLDAFQTGRVARQAIDDSDSDNRASGAPPSKPGRYSRPLARAITALICGR
ncbi:MAG: hypothetical protein OXC93_06115 [Rhodospirillaceae bacterium]|nr:hypothetical protein [Rhodospirillaceae bacterium]